MKNPIYNPTADQISAMQSAGWNITSGMNKPANTRQASTDSLEQPRILTPGNLRYHPAAYGLADPVVIWSEPFGETAGCQAGTHDGIRDGAGSGAPPKGWTRYYCELADWLEAGNPHPA